MAHHRLHQQHSGTRGHVFSDLGFLVLFLIVYQQFPSLITTQTTQIATLATPIILPPSLSEILRGPDRHPQPNVQRANRPRCLRLDILGLHVGNTTYSVHLEAEASEDAQCCQNSPNDGQLRRT